MSRDRWSPRGEPTWPDWRRATPGQRVAHVRTGRLGTFVRGVGQKHAVAVIEWDDAGFGVVRGSVVAPAYDLRPAATR